MSSSGRLRALAAILFPGVPWERLGNRVRDVMHLATHAMHRRDIFVTRDVKDYIHSGRGKPDRAKQTALRERYGLLVMTPEEGLEEVRRRLGIGGRAGHRTAESEEAPG